MRLREGVTGGERLHLSLIAGDVGGVGDTEDTWDIENVGTRGTGMTGTFRAVLGLVASWQQSGSL